MSAANEDHEGTPAAVVIPITRGLRGEFNANFGMALFLLSWGITFFGLFIAYLVVWHRAAVWPPAGTPPLRWVFPLCNTVIAGASSLAFDAAVRGARRNRPADVRRWLSAAGLLGFSFLILQTAMWAALWRSGFVLGINNFAGMFYALTWFHALHVLVGLVVLAALAPRAWRGGYTATDHRPLRLSGWFWHFVTIAWLGVFFLLWAL